MIPISLISLSFNTFALTLSSYTILHEICEKSREVRVKWYTRAWHYLSFEVFSKDLEPKQSLRRL